MIKRAKTKRNLISILSALLGVVFAFSIAVTYAASALQLRYDQAPHSTSAYLGNQQYHLINDTTTNPIPFGEGTHNFEVALDYAIDYNFDVCLEYELIWSNDRDVDNVILNFANRDNVIYDENYIFLANPITKGNGKIVFITGVDFVDVKDATYFGETLQIEINLVKIYKEQDNYTLASHPLTKNIQSSLAAQTWINYKNRASMEEGIVLMYNQRNNFDNGVPYPGFETAYKKPTITTGEGDSAVTEVSGSKWLGGNKSYAGVGMFVVSGSSPLRLQIEVAAIWREKNKDGIVDVDKDSNLISENSIKLNYTKDWEHETWDELKLWETKKLSFEIPAKTACYINILENIEITSASRVASNAYDSYRAVINSIKINKGLILEDDQGETYDAETYFEYTESTPDFIQMETIYNNENIKGDLSVYQKDNVRILNSSTYSNNLYVADIASASSQTFNTSISAVNNTEFTQIATISYALKYYISNGNTAPKNSEGLRAEELFSGSNEKEIFDSSNVCYGYSIDATSRLTNSSTYETEIIINPYSSVDLVNIYEVDYQLQSDVQTKFKVGSSTEFYDVWTYLDVSVTETDQVEASNEKDENGYYSENDYLIVENVTSKTSITNDQDETLSVTRVSLRVKNSSNKVIKGVTISSVAVKELKQEIYGELVDGQYVAAANKPNDWDASYWKYYTKENGNFLQVKSSTLTNNTWPANTYYLKSQTYETLSISPSGEFEKSGSVFTNASIELLPGETVEFATAVAKNSNTGSVVTSGVAYATSVKIPNEFTLINEGKSNAYFVNYSSNSYYLRFVGNIVSKPDEIEQTDITITVGEGEEAQQVETKNNHYIGIVRPGQIINISMTTFYEFEILPIENSDVFSETTLTSWHSDAVNRMKTLFGIE